jgi:hypothetical protein
MGKDSISDLWPTTGLLFIPQVIYAHGKLGWNNINRGKIPDLFTRDLWKYYLVANQEELGEGNDEFSL